MLVTIAIGLASVSYFRWISENLIYVGVDLPEMESDYGTFVITKRNWKGFELFGHGWGGRNSYGGENTITAYETGDCKRVSYTSGMASL